MSQSKCQIMASIGQYLEGTYKTYNIDKMFGRKLAILLEVLPMLIRESMAVRLPILGVNLWLTEQER